MEKITFDTFTSASIRIRQERVPAMEKSLEEMLESLRTAISGWTKQALIDDIAIVNPAYLPHLKGNENKADLIEHHLRATRLTIDTHEAINNFQAAARADVRMAERLNDLIDTGRGRRQELAELLAKPGSSVGRLLQWKGDDAATADVAAEYAATVTKKVNAGEDIYDATQSVMHDALQELVGFPRAMKANGASGATKADNLWTVLGAQEFINVVQSSYGAGRHPDPMTFDVTYLR